MVEPDAGSPLRGWTATVRATAVLPARPPSGRSDAVVCVPGMADAISKGDGCAVAPTPLIVRLPMSQPVG